MTAGREREENPQEEYDKMWLQYENFREKLKN